MSERVSSVPRLPRRQAESGANTMERVRESLRGLQHGEVTVVVQDGIVVQIRRTDRVRLSAAEAEAKP